MKIKARRVRVLKSPFLKESLHLPAWEQGRWPAFWLKSPSATKPAVVAYRLRFSLSKRESIRIHVSADERYALYLDGVRMGRGPERCDTQAWCFETYDLKLPPGNHVIAARVSVLGDYSPLAQMSVEPGFFLVADDRRWEKIVTTGFAPWETKELKGYSFKRGHGVEHYFPGAHDVRDGEVFPWGYEDGKGPGWKKAVVGEAASQLEWHAFDVSESTHRMRPAWLPPMRETPWKSGRVACLFHKLWDGKTPLSGEGHVADDLPQWTRLLRGDGSVRVPPNSIRTLLIDAEDYLCAYPEFVVSGGRHGEISLGWAEALFEKTTGMDKGNRDEIDGKYFRTVPDSWRCDGGSRRHLDTLWWRAGRYLLLTIRTAQAPLHLHRFTLLETRYPLEMESSWASDGYPVPSILKPSIRAMQMCAHETYMDCPYYEQLMYAGDTRTEVLTTFAMTRDELLPRKAIELFNLSLRPWGMIQSRYPCRVGQEIPPFSLWWVGMVHDFALWRGDPDFIRRQMPGVRSVLDGWEALINRAGLVEAPPGWAFVDWVRKWETGIPPSAAHGVSSILNWHLVYTLRRAADLESWLNEPERAARAKRRARELASRIHATFWRGSRGLYADDATGKFFSEHAQCLALLSGERPKTAAAALAARLFDAPDLARTTIYFSHYLFEVCRSAGRMDVFWKRLSLWSDLEKQGFKTTPEEPEPSRSDCHAWGAHPLYHLYASVLGIRPATFGFGEVEINPRLGPLRSVSATLVHPRGSIEIELETAGKIIRGRVRLPAGVKGRWQGRQTLRPKVWNDLAP